MAPKRSNVGAKAPAAKKAKTASVEAPLLAFVAAAKELPKPCRDMLQAALPFCLEVVESERHKFQADILDRLARMLADVEAKKRGGVSEVEAELAQVEGEKAKASADSEAKKIIAANEQSKCDEKGKIVDAARDVKNGAQEALTTAQKNEEEFNAKKAALFSEQESFAMLLGDIYQPLKEGTLLVHPSKRSKLIGELKKKMKEIGAQDSLGDSLEAALKVKPDKRDGAFIKVTIQFAEELFAKHTAKVAADISALDPEAATLAAAITAADAALAAKKGELDVVSKEWDAMQDVWLKLEKEFAEAASTLKSLEFQIPNLQDDIAKAQADLEKFMELPALFAKLKEHSTAVPEEPEAEEAAAEVAEEAAPADEEMPAASD